MVNGSPVPSIGPDPTQLFRDSHVSPRGEAQIAALEGRVLRAYRDAVGVTTIAYGFTMRSRVFAEWWTAKYGRPLQAGDTISIEDADALLTRMLDAEYCPGINPNAGPTLQSQFDACASVSWNAGPGSLRDGWARLLKAGDVHGAAAALRSYKLTGGILTRRRTIEAKLLEEGIYTYGREVVGTPAAPSVSNTAAAVKDYQTKLATLGYYKGPIDGLIGSSDSAVRAYQKDHPHLTDDGVVGPATRASLDRDVAARAIPQASASAGATGAVIAVGAGAVAKAVSNGGIGWHHLIFAGVIFGVVIGVIVLLAAMRHYSAERARAKGLAPPVVKEPPPTGLSGPGTGVKT